jgi:hypothetical protein
MIGPDHPLASSIVRYTDLGMYLDAIAADNRDGCQPNEDAEGAEAHTKQHHLQVLTHITLTLL